MISGEEIAVQGNKVNYLTGVKTPFEYKVKTYPHPASMDKGIKTAGVLSTANYILYAKLPNGAENPLPEGSPLQHSGIQYGDRIVWADGEMIFSETQLSHILNDNRALLTIDRDGKTILRRVPRVEVQELKLDPAMKDELVDWQFEAQLNGTKLPKLYTIPYKAAVGAIRPMPGRPTWLPSCQHEERQEIASSHITGLRSTTTTGAFALSSHWRPPELSRLFNRRTH